MENILLEKNVYCPEFEKCCTERDRVWMQISPLNSNEFVTD